MKKTILILLFLLSATLTFAGSRITKTYTQSPLPEVLIDIDKAAPEIDIRFIYNKLEDYTVTCSIQNATPLEAVQQAVGFYPIKVSQKGTTIIVEPALETKQKLIGRVVDEKGNPLEFANVTLYSPTDDSIITGGVTNAGGDFVIPCTVTRFTVKVSYVGYETLVRTLDFSKNKTSMDLGTLSLKVDPQVIAEVNVEGVLATTSAEKTTYYPTSRHKNAATDATSLLQHMMIPQLRLNPFTGYVTTLSGESVAIFIDYISATAQDLEGMNTQDVKRVEIYDFPSDVRFQGKAHVVNFIMQKYEIGGYTKLTSIESALTDFSANNSVYSKLSLKNWMFDANATTNLSKQTHLGSKTIETFNLPTRTITRTENFADGKQEIRQTSISFRATYIGEKMHLSNRLEFLDNNTPRQELQGNVLYNPTIFNPSTSTSRQDFRDITPTYIGDWNFQFPRQWMLNIQPKFQFSHNKQNRFYQEGELQAIENNIKENMHNLEWALVAGKTFKKSHTLLFGNVGLEYGSNMDYCGSTNAHQKMKILSLGFPIIYQFNTQKLNLSAQIVPAFQRNTVSETTLNEWFSLFNTSVSYAFNQKNSLAADITVQRAAADGAKRNPSVLQRNELLYYSGNPLVENYNNFIGNIRYTWIPSNKFTVSAYLQHVFINNYIAYNWQPYGNNTILQTIDNVGNLHNTNIGASLTLRLLNGNLQLSAMPELTLRRISGCIDVQEKPFTLNLAASYYLKQFYFMAGYTSPKKSFDKTESATIRQRSSYYLTAGWGNAHWKAKLDIVNPFRTDWRDTRTTIAAPFYSQTSDAFNSSNHQRLTLTISYLFNYGKKVKQGDELGTASGGQSSIL